LPHGHPWDLLFDVAILREEGSPPCAEGSLTVTDEHCEGHFPSIPVFPAVMMIEVIAQTIGVLFIYRHRDLVKGKLPVFVKATGFEDFRSPQELVRPGDQLMARVRINHVYNRGETNIIFADGTIKIFKDGEWREIVKLKEFIGAAVPAPKAD
jgi:3-hydroxymyristoyl/3-hydroxydecanoyl-(acyl carrier protein) dehydratase